MKLSQWRIAPQQLGYVSLKVKTSGSPKIAHFLPCTPRGHICPLFQTSLSLFQTDAQASYVKLIGYHTKITPHKRSIPSIIIISSEKSLSTFPVPANPCRKLAFLFFPPYRAHGPLITVYFSGHIVPPLTLSCFIVNNNQK